MNRLTVRNSEGIGVLKQPFQCERCGDLQWSLPDLGEGSPTDRLAEYESIGLLPEQLKEIDKLYTEKCEEVAKLQKELKRYRDLEEQCITENYAGIEVMLRKFAEFKANMHELYEYKELEREGKLIKLAWAAGDAYFKIETAFWRNEQECKGCRYYHEGDDILRDDSCCTFEDYEENEGKWPSCAKVVIKIFKNVEEIIHCMENGSIGETVFSTHKEAEAVLRELKEKGD